MEVIALFIVLGAVVGYFAYQSHQRTVATWRNVAAKLGLGITGGSGVSRPTMSGNLNGLPVRIDTYTQRSGNSSTTYTRYQVQYPPVGFDLNLKREGGLSFVSKLFGIEDVQVGDPVFDGAFKIKTSDRNRLIALLTPSVRNGLFRLMASYPTTVVTENHMGLTVRKFESNGERLASTIQRLVATAQLLTSPTAGVSDQNVTDREQGLLGEVADRMRQAVEEHPEDIDQRIFEVETLAAAGDETTARERVAELERIAPADPDVAGWRDALSVGPPTAPVDPAHIDASTMAEELFSGDDLSFETRSKFNSKYAGAKVNWEGKVKQVRRRGPSATVAITVATVRNDLYGNTDIDVVVETAADTAPTEGAQVTISGMLGRIDPLVRNIYLDNADLS
ncbi:MAG: hypothetical protein QNJ75_07765 [Acidimicrobiia bacterium]|nr:hypothetical protein [Acidimicrobiia bacterium]